MLNLRVLAAQVQQAELAVQRKRNPKFIYEFGEEVMALRADCKVLRVGTDEKQAAEELLIRMAIVKGWRRMLERPQAWGSAAAAGSAVDGLILERSNDRLCALLFVNCAIALLRAGGLGLRELQFDADRAFALLASTGIVDEWLAKAKLLQAIGGYVDGGINRQVRTLAAEATACLQAPELKAIGTALQARKSPPTIDFRAFSTQHCYKHH